MHKSSPFSRLKAVMQAVAGLALGSLEWQRAFDKAGGYTSRGKGKNKPSGKGYGLRGYNWPPKLLNQNGAIPVARRLRQRAALEAKRQAKEARHGNVA